GYGIRSARWVFLSARYDGSGGGVIIFTVRGSPRAFGSHTKPLQLMNIAALFVPPFGRVPLIIRQPVDRFVPCKSSSRSVWRPLIHTSAAGMPTAVLPILLSFGWPPKQRRLVVLIRISLWPLILISYEQKFGERWVGWKTQEHGVGTCAGHFIGRC